MLIAAYASSQAKSIMGHVTDEQGQAVPFASVKIKNSKMGAAADSSGSFVIRANTGETLLITATGFNSKEVTVGTENVITIIITKTINELNSIVVTTALGQTQSKARIGYSASTFNTDAINKTAPVSLLDGLAGKVAGADISQTGGPGSSTKVVLRGYGVIAGGGNQPLYVIDGVPLSNAQFENNSGLTNSADFGDGLSGINPNDIQSITILKGTAASSLYGSLARNGAIMITTKKGRSGKLRVEINSSANFSQVGKLPEYQSEFGQGWGGLFVNTENGSWGPKYTGQMNPWGAVVNNSQLEKPFSFLPNNLRDFYTTGSEYNNTISLSGGTDITRFYFSYGNVTSDGVVPTKSDYLQRNTFALRTNSNFGKFALNTSFNYLNQRLNVPSTGQLSSAGGGVFQSVLQIPADIPIADFADYKNLYFNTDNYFTPYAENPYFGLNEDGNKQN
ncbi:MAG TPA: TonB-dependent receptor plug domain-containing protein, partial [Parafilimonas sp.]